MSGFRVAALLLSSLVGWASAFSPLPAIGASMTRRRPSQISLRELPAEVDAALSWEPGTYDPKDVEDLWEGLIGVYESEDAAASAAKQVRGSILCPLYASPTLLQESKAALVEVLGEDAGAALDLGRGGEVCELVEFIAGGVALEGAGLEPLER